MSDSSRGHAAVAIGELDVLAVEGPGAGEVAAVGDRRKAAADALVFG